MAEIFRNSKVASPAQDIRATLGADGLQAHLGGDRYATAPARAAELRELKVWRRDHPYLPFRKANAYSWCCDEDATDADRRVPSAVTATSVFGRPCAMVSRGWQHVMELATRWLEMHTRPEHMNPAARTVIATFLVTLSTAAQGPVFEAASIKRNTSGNSAVTNGSTPGRFVMINAPVRSLIAFAYPLPSGEIVGGPDWISSERYDVNATAGYLAPRDEMAAMVRALLAERFQFAGHIEPRRRPTYALMLARSDGRLGPQIGRSELDCAAILVANDEAARGSRKPPPAASNGAPPCGMRQDAGGPLRSGGLSMDLLATLLSRSAGRPVVNKTGLLGNYEFVLDYSPPVAGPDSPRDDRPTMFTAVREQLGLKLEAEDGPLDVLVIDAIERPSPN